MLTKDSLHKPGPDPALGFLGTKQGDGFALNVERLRLTSEARYYKVALTKGTWTQAPDKSQRVIEHWQIVDAIERGWGDLGVVTITSPSSALVTIYDTR